MDNINVERKTSEWSRTRRRRKAWQRVLAGMMAVVVFSTTYALILPAITKEQEVFCGHAEHEHIDACYERVLICGYPAEEQGAEVLLGGGTAAQAWEGEATDADAEDGQRAVEDAGPYEGYVSPAGDVTPGEPSTPDVILSAGAEGAGVEGSRPAAQGASDDGILTSPSAPQNDSNGGAAPQNDSNGDASPAAQEGTTPAPDRHVHTDECYELQLVCELEAHTHSLACFSNPEADLESAESWTRSVAAVELSGDWAADLVAIAESQLGNGESANNYAVNENGDKQGYTRYAAWWSAEAPYDPWCAMFVSFCLNYANISETAVPRDSGCIHWQETLMEQGLWREPDFYTPAAGDIIFFDYDFNNKADHVGLVSAVEEDTLTTIEGNNSTKVEKYTYELNDERILGYAALPANPELAASDGGILTSPSAPQNDSESEDGATAATAQNEEIVRLSTEAAGMKVTLAGPASSLPWPIEELELRVVPLDDPETVARIEAELETPPGTVRRSTLVDISIWRLGEEVQPEGPVTVRFDGFENENRDAQVFHLGEEVEEHEALVRGDALSFETDHFSPFLLTGTWKTQNIGDEYIPGAARVSALSLKQVTGTPDSFDASGNPVLDADDEPGNDSSLDNDIVRSFDRVFFDLGYTVNLTERYEYLRNIGAFRGFKSARLYVRATLPLSPEQAEFDFSAMPGLELLDQGVDDPSNPTQQWIYGYFTMLAADAEDYIIPSTGGVRFAVYVKGMQDYRTEPASVIQPVFNAWLDQGETGGTDQNPVYTPDHKRERIQAEPVKVSSAARYNVRLKTLECIRTSSVDYAAGTWVKAVTVSKNGYFMSNDTGDLVVFGLVVELETTADKGIKGVAFHQNTVNFELFAEYEQGTRSVGTQTQVSYSKSGSSTSGDYRPRLWAYSRIDGSSQGPASDAVGAPMRNLPTTALTVLPYSERSLSSETDPTVNAVKNSGTMTVHEKSASDYTLQLSFSGIENDFRYPSKAAVPGDLSWTDLPADSKILACGLVTVYYPIMPCPNSGTERLYNCILSARSIVPSDSNGNDDAAAFSGVLRVHSSGNSFSGALFDETYTHHYNQNFARLSRGDGFYFRVSSNHSYYSDTRSFGADITVSFDGTKFRPDTENRPLDVSRRADINSDDRIPGLPAGWTTRIYYIADLNGGYKAIPKWDLTMGSNCFNTLADLEAAGKTCNAVWVELRSGGNRLADALPADITGVAWVAVPFRVTDSAPSSVLPGTSDTDFYYTTRNYPNLSSTTTNPLLGVSNTVASYRGSFKNIPLTEYCGGFIYSPLIDNRVRSGGGAHYVRASGQWAYDARGMLLGVNGFSNGIFESYGLSGTKWTKLATYTLNSNGSGAKIVIVNEEVTLEKDVAMESAPGQPRNIFAVEDGERAVDYVLRPSVRDLSNLAHSTEIVLTDDLPVGLQYVPGSARLGGDYEQPSDRISHGQVNGGTVLLDNGTVRAPVCAMNEGDVDFAVTEVTEGGKTFQRLSWTLHDVTTGSAVPRLYYSATIGNATDPMLDVQDQTVLLNTATCKSSLSAMVEASTSITVQRLGVSTVIKRVEQEEVELNAPIRYAIDYVNNSDRTLGNVRILDILPWNGDPRGSSFNGSYTVKTVTVTQLNDAVMGDNTYTMSFTTTAAPRSQFDDPLSIDTSGFTSASRTVSGKATTFTLPDGTRPSMLCFTGNNVGAYAKARIVVTLEPTGNRDKDIYYNDVIMDAYVDPDRTQRAIPAPVYAAPVHAEVAVDTVELTVKKTVLVGDKTKAFPIRVSWTDGAATTTEELQLKDGDTGTLTIPVGANVTITETEHPGYTVLIKEGSQTLARGDSYTIQSIAAARSIEVENTAGAPLPNSGGLGTALPVAFGLMTMAGAVGVGLARRRRIET